MGMCSCGPNHQTQGQRSSDAYAVRRPSGYDKIHPESLRRCGLCPQRHDEGRKFSEREHLKEVPREREGRGGGRAPPTQTTNRAKDAEVDGAHLPSSTHASFLWNATTAPTCTEATGRWVALLRRALPSCGIDQGRRTCRST
ncbi:hypothetical protein VTO73DRAFT_12819 [Trametes versicolor]